MVEQPVDASALAFLEEIEANDLEDEYMKLVHAGFHKSPALKERMREVMRRREVLRQKGRKRRKRRTPRTSSLPSRRPRRRLRRWHAPGWFSSAFLLALCSSLSLAGPRCSTSRLLDQKNSCAFFLYSGICKAGIAGTLHLAMCLFPGLQAHDARHHGRYGTRRTFLRLSTLAVSWSGAALGRGCRARCVQRHMPWSSCLHCGR